MANLNQLQSAFPAKSKQAAGLVNGVSTEVDSVYFADKIVITITQGGRLAQWIQVPLDTSNPNHADHHITGEAAQDSLLPMSHLTPKTLLGAGNSGRETMGQLLATQIASKIATRSLEETRTIMVGLGLEDISDSREAFFDLIDLVSKCI